MPLRTEVSCEIEDLIREVVVKSGKSYDEVETAMFRLYLYPENTKTYITTQFGPVVKSGQRDAYKWLNDALTLILEELGINGIYITLAI